MTSMKPGHVAIFDQAAAEVDDLIDAWREQRTEHDRLETIGGLSIVLADRHGTNYAQYQVLLFAAIEKLAARTSDAATEDREGQ